ncbi:MAG: threonylcarbamoyl-AMP synthase [Candidatus Lloydbacteria bacterium RIFCSPHIGHO2_02_FULL_54_17]|uniref:L-threonylcarbamoyladenylate synthase n=1 Tax=Candidatus Lloydbacteria bacterium RIFCSPHIGHO2_02_FULL_54_17 TaxID=1798664 RepID=A0A1G2DAH7_9BACT|nr:MAG: threonylcarbamoyl-AMP synthase [Candidatus Lloydbacteria bacterium RIFCSPHIGHO2_01_FULL_54_11]OGZ10625.1 MAG: threonylcarbamoyl-AMP synthase [Candidatus Lloydbacteria bacterium RIFCSPHIGHO2_02_FULL_54_17]OGZ13660.1 MAG: threonylcarbamoyl-AMP synthase [Candidatus Lloydbacteria bacterium RIFCSPLOWO2_01_FULL_54_18]OGZ16096.1 MAG: threonylcarbamoyl-AMP synthase [Candidatus Lloydbacteria bacterium RIFCSPLOWO2_02_FULL_54_12]
MSTNSEIVETLRAGGVGVLSTDTLYGLVGSALLPEAVERIYELKRRDREKPLIVLIADIEDVERFGVVLSEELILQLEKYWPHSSSAGAEALRGKPGPYSVILPSVDDEFSYLHRGGGTIAFRLPDKDDLCELLRDVGPLVAPSANIEGKHPARTVEEARRYFGDDVDFYVDGGELSGKSSAILEFNGDEIRVVRE